MAEPDDAPALVTGTSTGLGRVIAVALAREGYDLAVTELRVDALKDTLAEPDIRKRKVVPIALDLARRTASGSAFDRRPRNWATSTCWSTMPAAR